MEKLSAESFSILNFPFSISKWGRNGFDGGVEAGIAGRSGALRKKLQFNFYKLNNNNSKLLAA